MSINIAGYEISLSSFFSPPLISLLSFYMNGKVLGDIFPNYLKKCDSEIVIGDIINTKITERQLYLGLFSILLFFLIGIPFFDHIQKFCGKFPISDSAWINYIFIISIVSSVTTGLLGFFLNFYLEKKSAESEVREKELLSSELTNETKIFKDRIE